MPRPVLDQGRFDKAEDVAPRILPRNDIIVQAAATTSGIRDTAFAAVVLADNAVMNSLIFSVAHDLKVGHVVFFSCSVMLRSSDLALTESDFDANAEIEPRYFGAAWTKLYIEKMCEFYAGFGTTRYAAIRHSNIYGPHDHKFDLERSHVFGATVTKVMTATDGRVVVWGSGEEARDLLHVDSLVDFVAAAIDRQRHQSSYNCGAGSAITVKEPGPDDSCRIPDAICALSMT